MTSPSLTNLTQSSETPDILDALAGLPPEMPLQALRAARADVVRYAQGSYLALLEPADPAGVSRVERELIALEERLGCGEGLAQGPAGAGKRAGRRDALHEAATRQRGKGCGRRHSKPEWLPRFFRLE